MRGILGAAATAAVLAGIVAAAAIGARPATHLVLPVGSAAAVAVPATAGAHPVTLTLRARLLMTCGRPGPGPIVVSLPAAERVPRAIARSAVLAGGSAPLTVRVAGHTVTLTLPRPPGVTCLVIAPGTLTIVFSRAAGLGNPSAAGTYALSVRIGAQSFRARLTIKPA
ncbi:MAG TPA: hypothetical protein VMU58_11610 [Gaiellaceae bacterium]|nr:hypothetical protein [Gaiellaceae bacterium]